jgi:hypothetical protein
VENKKKRIWRQSDRFMIVVIGTAVFFCRIFCSSCLKKGWDKKTNSQQLKISKKLCGVFVDLF